MLIMLTPEQKMLMVQMIFNEKEVLFGEFGPDLSKVEKQEKWIEILVKLNSLGANLTDYKVRSIILISQKFVWHHFFISLIDFQILRDNEWSNTRRATEKKVATLKSNEDKPEEERIQCKPLTPLDDVVLDILDKGKVRALKSFHQQARKFKQIQTKTLVK